MTILFLSYMIAITGFDVVWHSLGANILYYHPQLPLTEEYTGEATFIPAILLFIYVVLSSIHFIRLGWIGLKNKGGKK